MLIDLFDEDNTFYFNKFSLTTYLVSSTPACD